MDENAIGTLTLKSARKIPLGSAKARILTLGSASFVARDGQSLRVTVRLTRRVMAILLTRQSLRIRATVKLRDTAGNASTTHYDFNAKTPHTN